MIEKVELDLPEHNETKLSYQSVSERTLNKRVTSILHDAWLTTEFLSPCVITVDLSALYCSIYFLQVSY
jgi:hypothetical protein